jgi:tetratricopeptide (TPR) repeat protein
MGRSSISSILVLALAFQASRLGSETAPYSPPDAALPRLEASIAVREWGGLSEPLSPDDFLSISVHFSSVDPNSGDVPESAQKVLEILRGFLAEEAPKLYAIADEYARADAALLALHHGLFKRYDANATGTDGIALGGSYNCVSSAVLYAALAKASGLRVIGVEAKDHAFCAVFANGSRIDVETTNPYGFDPGKKKDVFTDSFGRVTGYAYVPPENYRMRSDIGEKELLSLILRNRMSALEAVRRQAAALSLAADLYAFMPSEKTRLLLGERSSNSASLLLDAGKPEEALVLLDAIADVFASPPNTPSSLPRTDEARYAAIRNALSAYGSSGSYDDGASFIAYARARYGDDPVYAEFERMRANNGAVELLNAGKYDEALGFIALEAAAGRCPPAEAAKLRENAALAWVLSLRGVDAFKGKIALASSLAKDGSLGERKFAELLLSLCGQEANAIASRDAFRGWLDAATAFDAGLALLPDERSLRGGRSTCLDNFEAAVLNRSASLFNAGKNDESIAALEEGLRLLPAGKRMKSRLESMKKAAKP